MMQLTSSAFKQGEKIPSRYTCDGTDVSPPLQIEGVPAAAKSLVLIMEDPDVPHYLRKDGLWVHWVLFNIPPQAQLIAEGKTPPSIPGVGTEGKTVYRGPAPPDREHRYFFLLYALDCQLSLSKGATKEEVVAAMQSHILEETQLMGRYERIR